MKYFFGLLFLLFTMGSCVEIIDDLYVKSDGSGTFKYTVNLSSSVVKINSILALDSLDGRKVPSISEIQEKLNAYVAKLEKKDGLSNIKLDANYKDFIFKFQCDFTNVQVLQKAIKEIVQEENKNTEIKELDHNWLVWDGSKLTRSIPTMPEKITDRMKKEDAEALQKGTYLSISRFDRIIEKYDNPVAKLSGNKLAILIKTNPYSLTQNTELLENTIYLSGLKK